VERTFARVSGLLAIGFLGVLATPVLTGHVSVAWDHGALYLPMRAFYAQCDGVPTRLERVNGDFMGCVVIPGTHEVLFEYHPAGLQQARVVSGVGAILAFGLVACGVVFRRRERRQGVSERRAVRHAEESAPSSPEDSQ
jgi:hypothetical protein